jgi:hypothetical protein
MRGLLVAMALVVTGCGSIDRPLPPETKCGGFREPCCGESKECDEPFACIHDANYDTTFCTGKL